MIDTENRSRAPISWSSARPNIPHHPGVRCGSFTVL